MTASVQFSHPSAPVTIGSTPWELVALTLPARTWRRRVVEGGYQHGRALIGAVLETGKLTVTARLSGTTWTQVDARLNTLTGATSQRTYTATVTIGGVARVFECEPADVYAEDVDRSKVAAYVQDVTLEVPVQVG
ncbi:hypothetical protein [Cellulomonas uda]|uniref:Uncharacterized protein n=1 Tax=Cellulomonas uda TaxID=1714 RepID=A0A4Y3KAA3_CELUD|nr:hypothetical protein [Cellulomonas uda]NII65557.1 hypothetical protein [Cellulomonas uda]GEA81411.1 hypothetical protein CUD01_18550 [Cellulomonas uda]